MEKSQWNKQISRLFPSTDETNLLFRWLRVCVFCLTSVLVVCSIFPEKNISFITAQLFFVWAKANPCNENGIVITIRSKTSETAVMSGNEQNHWLEVINLCETSRLLNIKEVSK